MKEQPFDELQQVFREAQVDLPPGLEARLRAIPALQERPSFLDLRWLAPVLALIPGFLWVAIRYGSGLYNILTNATRSLSLPELPRITALRDFTLPDISQIPVLSELILPALSTITPIMVLIYTATVTVVAGLAVGFYLRRESQMDVQYMQLLNRSR
ncbi:MAG: hypothetical protein JSU77_07165 [Fidelibacterota bacterium]|nr:MAG: hypothetical protein JSU77_07165 [Candidatus Neomarinimicrobiota bacterium]